MKSQRDIFALCRQWESSVYVCVRIWRSLLQMIFALIYVCINILLLCNSITFIYYIDVIDVTLYIVQYTEKNLTVCQILP